jgi:integrase
MSLKVVKRPGTSSLWIVGTVLGQRIRESAGTDNPSLAEERRAAREAEIYRGVTHGVTPTKAFAEVALSYLKKPLSDDAKARLNRFLRFLKETKRERIGCDKVNQVLLDEACERMLRDGSSPSTRLREVFTPVKAVLRHGAIRSWCALPVFESIPQGRCRKEWLTVAEAQAILAASPEHLRPMFELGFCCGARRGELLSVDWRFVQLQYARATLRDVKSKGEVVKDRIVDLNPRAVACLAGLPGDKVNGRIFMRADGTDWHPNPAIAGRQVNDAFKDIAKSAGIGRHVTLHVVRHSWASWHYAKHKDLKRLAADGAWDSVEMADRYSHLAPQGMVAEIDAFWGVGVVAGTASRRRGGGQVSITAPG